MLSFVIDFQPLNTSRIPMHFEKHYMNGSVKDVIRQ